MDAGACVGGLGLLLISLYGLMVLIVKAAWLSVAAPSHDCAAFESVSVFGFGPRVKSVSGGYCLMKNTEQTKEKMNEVSEGKSIFLFPVNVWLLKKNPEHYFF